MNGMRNSLQAAWRHEKFRFLVVGVFNTIFGYLVFLALYLAFGTRCHYLMLSAISHAISVLVAFCGQRTLVFHSTQPWPAEFIRYNVSLIFSFLTGLLCLYVLVEFAKLNPGVGQAITVAVSVVISYLTHRHYSFKR